MTVLPASRSLATALSRARSLATCSAVRQPQTPRINQRASAADAGHSCTHTPCTANPGSLIML